MVGNEDGSAESPAVIVITQLVFLLPGSFEKRVNRVKFVVAQEFENVPMK